MTVARVAVAMATYNGAAFLDQQLASILTQLPEDGQLVISDDGSRDGTWEKLELLAAQDSRVRLVRGPGRGLLQNFAHALGRADGDIIFLADQDDVWHPDKIEKVLATFARPEVLAVLHDARVIDGTGKVVAPSYFAIRQTGPGFWHNLKKNGFIGCCMAVRRELVAAALPLPAGIPMHDSYLGLLATCLGEVAYLRCALFDYRRHGGNQTGEQHGGAVKMISQRLGLYRAVRRRARQIKAAGGIGSSAARGGRC